MARLWTSGAEWNDVTAEQVTLASGVTISTTSPRSGTYCYAGSTSSRSSFVFTGALATTYYLRGYFNWAALPSLSPTILDIASLAIITVDSSGTIGLYNNSGAPILIGSLASAISVGNWYRIELAIQLNSGASDDYLEARLNGVSFGAASGVSLGTVAPANLGFSFGNTAQIDDLALNDSTGANENYWPGEGKVVLLKPISLNANGGSWTDDAAATTTAALTTAIDNTPPVGIADTTAGGGGHQDRNAGANTNLDMNLATYTTLGIAASDFVKVMVPMCCVSAPVSTGGKSGSFGVTTNPTITNRVFTGGTGTAAFFWGGVAAGTYPTGWRWERGTTTYLPTGIALGTSPVARLSITAGTTSRIAMCSDMGVLVEYAPRRSFIYDGRRRNLQKMIGR